MAQLTAEELRQGACYALQHSVNLAEDAATLFGAKRVTSSFHLAVMAREEMGKVNILWRTSLELGDSETISVDKVRVLFKSHEDKLRAGIASVAVRLSSQDRASWMTAISESNSELAATMSQKIRKMAVVVRKHAPSALHKRRLKSQYVDLNPDGTWSIPEIERTEAEGLIRVVMAEIANQLLAAQSDPLTLRAFDQIGQPVPQSGPFTQRIFAVMGRIDA